MTNPVLLNTREVAERFGVSQRQAQRLAKAGHLPVYGQGDRNTQYFRLADVKIAERTRA